MSGTWMQRHRKIAAGNRDQPGCGPRSGLAIDNCNCMRIREVDENLIVVKIELEAFRMGAQCNIGNLLESLGINYRQSTFAISDDDLIRGSIHPDIVRIIVKIDPSGSRIICSQECAHRSVARVGYVKHLHRWHVAHALRLVQSANGANELAVPQVDDPNAIIAELSNEETLPW